MKIARFALALACLILPSCHQAALVPPDPSLTERPAPPPPCPMPTPSVLAPTEDAELFFGLDAQGVQRYSCQLSGWVFIAPDADLFDVDTHRFLVHHFAGPTWLWLDSSSVLATAHANITVDPTAIPWLLVDVVSHGGAEGVLTPIRQIQRMETTGGRAPTTGCDASHIGAVTEVNYTARYFFYRSQTKQASHIRCGA